MPNIIDTSEDMNKGKVFMTDRWTENEFQCPPLSRKAADNKNEGFVKVTILMLYNFDFA